ncbi:CRISPR-associated protein Cas5 [Aeromonas dhakensis]|uniref:type I-F CRISPR-associated protein Csy3 n=1 Tax=Aeromonas dhakensis TaxID=196024 RepID=UPI000C0BC64D|nr:type I-F CRISPR-associated protein Csy3 [Aeromonas dhakensis]PHS87525.1 CRISPR-associated protein Cas5 [Aeromonas dhakensis]PHS90997.1 CRISPR-associated protein Cas5 [Aeromonas dhakensis]
MAKATIKTASVLAFERKLANSDAQLYAGNWQDRDDTSAQWRPITLQEKAVRGTISNRLKKATAEDPAKLDNEIQKPNLQKVDVATLPFDADTLRVGFTLRVLGNLAQPSACNDQAYQAVLDEKIGDYVREHQFHELAARYAENLANGRFLWRNRVGAEEVEVCISRLEQGSVKQRWVFDALSFNLRTFTKSQGALAELSEVIRQGLLGGDFALLKVEAFVRLGAGQEVFPSQELVLDQSGGKEGKKSKHLYQVAGIAAMHSQKIGNAIRTIDTWYPGAEELGPIAVEPYGSVTSRGTAYRQPKEKLDFYNLLDGWMLKDNLPAVDQQHYVMATLVRGGVFGEAD